MGESIPPSSISPLRSAWESIKTFSPVTIIGLALILLFLTFLSVDTVVIRWWLMMPISAAGCALFWIQHRSTSGAEARICLIGFWLMLFLFLLRDATLSRELANLFDTANHSAEQASEFNNALNDFFMGTGH